MSTTVATVASLATVNGGLIRHWELVGACSPWFEHFGKLTSVVGATDRDLAFAIGEGNPDAAGEWRRRYPEAPSGAKGWAAIADAQARRMAA